MMEAIHNLTVTMEKKMDALMSALSEIKKKHDHLELALEMQQVCTPTPVTEKPRKTPARSPTRSTPARTTPWYMSDSPSSSALTMPASKSTSTSLTGAISVTTDTPSKAAFQTTPTTSITTKAASKTSRKKVDDDSELLTVPIDPGVLLKLRYISASRQNFATNVMRKLFTRAERETSNVNGVLGKSQLDVERVEYIKSVTFKMYPLEQKESLESAWSKCRSAIDEANRRLYRPKKDHVPLP